MASPNTEIACIIFLQHTGFTIFRKNISSVIQFPFSPETVRDLEVFDEDKLKSEIKALVETNKIPASSSMLVLDKSVTFEKTVTRPPDNGQLEEIEDFLEYVPFENIATKVFTIDKTEVVVAVNKSLTESISSAFRDSNIQILLIIPLSIIRETPNQKSFTQSTASFVFSREDVFVPYNLLNSENALELRAKKKTNPPNKRVIILGGFLGILVLILIVLLFAGRISTSKESTVTQAKIFPTEVQRFLSPTPQHTIPISLGVEEASLSQKENTTIHLTFGTLSEQKKEALKIRLNEIGYTQISEDLEQTVFSNNVQFLHKKTLSQPVLSNIFNEVKVHFPTVETQEVSDLKYDVLIIISNST